jgi:hypothetical protein
MRRVYAVLSLGLATLLAGCVSVEVSARLTAGQLADPSQTAELELARSHDRRVVFEGNMYFTVCPTETCGPFWRPPSLFWTTPDSVTRKAPAGPVVLYAEAESGIADFHSKCHTKARFEAEGGHGYKVSLSNGCGLKVQDKASGALLPVQTLD